MRASSIGLATALLLSLTNCGEVETPETVVEEYRFRVERRLRELDSIGYEVGRRPPLKEVPVPFPGEAGGGQVEVVQYEEFDDTPSPEFSLLLSAPTVGMAPQVRRIMEHGPRSSRRDEKEAAADLRRMFDRFLEARYLLVLRTVEARKPGLVPPFSFKAGRIAVEAFLYDIEGGALRGGFTCDAKSSEVARGLVRTFRGVSLDSGRGVVDNDLRRNLKRALVRDWERIAPGPALDIDPSELDEPQEK